MSAENPGNDVRANIVLEFGGASRGKSTVTPVMFGFETCSAHARLPIIANPSAIQMAGLAIPRRCPMSASTLSPDWNPASDDDELSINLELNYRRLMTTAGRA